VELMKAGAEAERKLRVEQDIAELGTLIDEILLASRLDAVKAREADEDVDLLALAAEECARYEAVEASGEPVAVRGDPRLLRRMVRNLLENARRHGAPPIEVRTTHAEGRVELRVCDHGPGIPDTERDRVFQPFGWPAQATARGQAWDCRWCNRSPANTTVMRGTSGARRREAASSSRCLLRSRGVSLAARLQFGHLQPPRLELAPVRWRGPRLSPGRQPLPFGSLEIVVEDTGVVWLGYRLECLVPALAFVVRRLRSAYPARWMTSS
jgi:hypothetical protein